MTKARLDPDLAEPPPALPLLALNVLVASEMTAGEGQGRPPFYQPLRQWLDPQDNEQGAPGDYSDAVPACWEMLKSWLDKTLEGARGYSTITRHEHFVNIGYALQQAVLRTADRRRLSRFFNAIGLEPGEEVTGRELRQALAFWAKRQGSRGVRLRRLATEPHLKEYAENLLEIIASRWDGTIRNEKTGSPTGALHLYIRSRPFRLGFAALAKPGLPREVLLEDKSDSGEAVLLEADEKGAYLPLPIDIEVDSQRLRDGLVLESEELTLELAPSDAYAFHRHPAVDPDWVTTTHINLGEQHLLLVRSEFKSSVDAWLSDAGAEGLFAANATRKLPSGWVLFHGIRIDGHVAQAPPAAIADLLRAGGGSRIKLAGGLRVPGISRTYFTGGAPLLALPSDSSPIFSVELEGVGTETFTAENGNHLLGHVLQQPGTYHVRHELAEFEFDLTAGFSERPGKDVGQVRPQSRPGTRISGLVVSPSRDPLPPRRVPINAKSGLVITSNGSVGHALLPNWLPELGASVAAAWTERDPVWLLAHDPEFGVVINCLCLELPTVEGDGAAEFSRLAEHSLATDAPEDVKALLELYLEAIDD